jgi:hypothetical protein
MWYTKNFIKIAQQDFDVRAELEKYYPGLKGFVTSDNNKYSIILSDNSTLEGTLPELISKSREKKDPDDNTKRPGRNYQFVLDRLNNDISLYNTNYEKAYPKVIYDGDGLFKYKGTDEPKYWQEILKEFNAFKLENTSVPATPATPANKPNQETVLLSPVSNGFAQLQLPEELLNQYNEASNLGSNIKFILTQNPDGTNKLQLKEASQYYNQHPKLLEAIRLFLEKNGKFQFATDEQGNVIPGEYSLYQEGGVKPVNYQPAKLNIYVPGAAERTPVDLFLDGQKIATVINNTDFTFDTSKYPLLEGKHVLEARAEKVPSLTPIQDKYLKTLSKNRSYYFNIEEGKMPNLTTPINDLLTYKAANPESYGSGKVVEMSKNPYRSVKRDLSDSKTKDLQPAFKRYYTVKARLTNDPVIRKQFIDRAVALQNNIINSLEPNEYENYVDQILLFENSGQFADENALRAIIRKIYSERPNPPAAPAG